MRVTHLDKLIEEIPIKIIILEVHTFYFMREIQNINLFRWKLQIMISQLQKLEYKENSAKITLKIMEN